MATENWVKILIKVKILLSYQRPTANVKIVIEINVAGACRSESAGK
jgi:hypothetical protein